VSHLVKIRQEYKFDRTTWDFGYNTLMVQRAYLKNSDKEERHDSRKCHMDHCKCNRKWKFEVLWRQDPLQSKDIGCIKIIAEVHMCQSVWKFLTMFHHTILQCFQAHCATDHWQWLYCHGTLVEPSSHLKGHIDMKDSNRPFTNLTTNKYAQSK
jgi:hypothetical protein